MLAIKDLSISYGKIQAVKHVSLEVNKGEIVALIGLNGAGKSTLLKSIAGIINAESGVVMFNSDNVTNKPASFVARKGVSLVLEGRSTLKHMTVMENLVLGTYIRSDRDAAKHDIEQMLDRFPSLKMRVKQAAGTLSGGEQQMLVIARALLSRPQLLMLDEPSLGLAPLIIENIFELIQRVNSEGTTILLVEQNANQALRFSHRGYVMETGKIVLEDTGANLLSDDRVKKAYLGV
ncbi:ABC transporter ATP-binding protein [Pusillimonas sp. DMV24BSW_D]|uniref:ABC transporter ATP-binding protein n=1 Tax=Neopusillimonas maritima TaxID=2026239 RepID=A0A3A1YRF0_9BURK|nr:MULTISPECIES: ABC transporter ATP-binding protein [Alcaligenaceae]QIM50051.1 ABC transporter ATP-binding protein [Pusillimonas sp. DMV24BSW_D]RIY38984.1 ABC transporter ATP-binding protein [Neopusillimonas maritima]